MKNNSRFFFLAVLSASCYCAMGARAQSSTEAGTLREIQAAPQPGTPKAISNPLPVGSTIRVRLDKPLDAHKNKVGDEVIAKSVENVKSGVQVVIPKDSKIVGHLTEVAARTKEQPESVLAIMFDHAVLKDGTQIPLALSVQAVAAVTSGSSADMDSPLMAGASNGGTPPLPARGVPDGMGSAETRPAGSGGPQGAARSARPGVLGADSRGVIGIDGLELIPEVASPTGGSRLVSQKHNVHLDSGVQMLLRIRGQ